MTGRMLFRLEKPLATATLANSKLDAAHTFGASTVVFGAGLVDVGTSVKVATSEGYANPFTACCGHTLL